MYQLKSKGTREINGKETAIKTYTNNLTNNECVIYHLRSDSFGNQWWAFEDLFSLPFIRQLQAKKVLELYGHGLALEDIKLITGSLKAILRADKDPERYERAYAKVLELDSLAETMADPVKQCFGLCTVYLLFNDELPDAWSASLLTAKMTAMSNDIESQSFFLNWWTDCMRDAGQALKGLSRIASIVSQRETKVAAPLN